MTATGGTGRGASGGTRATVVAAMLVVVILVAIFLRGHGPIVITGSSGFPLLGGSQRVVLAAVMLVLVAAARATRLAVEAILRIPVVPAGVQLRGTA